MSFDIKLLKNDIAIDRDGSLRTVSDNEKLRQDIVKILITELGENKFHPSYGSKVGSIEIGHVPDQELLELDLSASTENSIRNLINLQRTQARRQFLTPGETIVDIVNINVERDLLDPRMYNVFISVLTQRLTLLTESVTVRIV